MKKFLRKYFLFSEENSYKPIQNSSFVMGVLALILFFSVGGKIINCYLVKQFSFIANLNTIDIVSEINTIRKTHGLEPLTVDPRLDLAATLKAEDMINKNYFSHNSPEGKDPWFWLQVVDYKYKYAGENLALNFWNDKETVRAWLNSPSHRDNILNPNYKETGVAILTGTTPTTKESKTVIVQMFGSKTDSPKLAVISESPLIDSTTTTTTLKESPYYIEEQEKVVSINRIEIDHDIAIEEESKKEFLEDNVVASLQDGSRVNEKSFVGYTLTKDFIDQDRFKIIDNGLGAGLLFLGIFGIINIYNSKNIKLNLKRKVLFKNFAILAIGIGFVLSAYSGFFANIKTPMF